MPDSHDDVSFRIVREALARRRKQLKLRPLADEVGIRSPTTVDNIIKGITKNPNEATRRSLREWHVRMQRKGYDTGESKEPTEETKLIAIAYLVQDYSTAEQKEFARDLYARLRECYKDTGARAPRWMGRLKKLIDAEWP